MTPFEIDILMHYVVNADEHPSVANPPPIWSETINRFYLEGLLCHGNGRLHDPTRRCVAYVKALQRVPLPTATWVIEGVDFGNLEDRRT